MSSFQATGASVREADAPPEFRRRSPGAKKATHAKLRAKDRPLANDFVSDEAFDQMLRAWFGNIAWCRAARLLHLGRIRERRELPAGSEGLRAVFLASDHLGQGASRPHPQGLHGQPRVVFLWMATSVHVYLGPNNATDVWSIKKVNPQSMIHYREARRAGRAGDAVLSRAGENALDLFGGSGSTLIAAEQTGRRAFLMELDPLYCDIIVARFEKFAGRKAERISHRSNAPVVAAEALEEAR